MFFRRTTFLVYNMFCVELRVTNGGFGPHGCVEHDRLLFGVAKQS